MGFGTGYVRGPEASPDLQHLVMTSNVVISLYCEFKQRVSTTDSGAVPWFVASRPIN